MDSITQAALGAAVGELTLGKKLGWKALAWGAFFGTLPDLDVLFSPFLDEAARLHWHRGISHSILIMILASLFLAKPLARLHQKSGVMPREAGWFIFWVWSTHVLIDVFTTYGTQIFEPFSDQRVALNNLFIIDPLFSGPLLLGILGVLFLKQESRARQLTMRIAVGISCFYVCLSFGVKIKANQVISQRAKELGGEAVAVAPTPINIVLWRGLIETPSGFHVTYWSLFDRKNEGHSNFFPKNAEFLEPFEGEELLESLKWFSRGWWTAHRTDKGTVVFVDRRFGEVRDVKSGYLFPMFQWHLQRDESGKMIAPNKRPKGLDLKASLILTWNRM